MSEEYTGEEGLIATGELQVEELQGEILEVADQEETEAIKKFAQTEVVQAGSSAEEQEKTLLDATFKAARLLNQRVAAMDEVRTKTKEKNAELVRALKLLELKPEMEQTEMAELLGLRLRILDHDMELLEKAGAVRRILPEEPDMRTVRVSVTDTGRLIAKVDAPAIVKGESFIPGLTDEAIEKFRRMLSQVSAALEATGLSDERKPKRDDDRSAHGSYRNGNRSNYHYDRGGRSGAERPGSERGGYRSFKDGGRSAHYDSGSRAAGRGGSRSSFGGRSGSRGSFGGNRNTRRG